MTNTVSYVPSNTIISERPTVQLRWCNGVLQQKWAIEEIEPRRSLSHEWRPVPTENTQ